MKQLKIVKAKHGAIVPKRNTKYSAGLDLYSCEKIIIKAKKRKLVSTGIIMELPEGTYGRIAPRSGLSINNCIDIGGKTFISNEK